MLGRNFDQAVSVGFFEIKHDATPYKSRRQVSFVVGRYENERRGDVLDFRAAQWGGRELKRTEGHEEIIRNIRISLVDFVDQHNGILAFGFARIDCNDLRSFAFRQPAAFRAFGIESPPQSSWCEVVGVALELFGLCIAKPAQKVEVPEE